MRRSGRLAWAGMATGRCEEVMAMYESNYPPGCSGADIDRAAGVYDGPPDDDRGYLWWWDDDWGVWRPGGDDDECDEAEHDGDGPEAA